MFFKQYYLGCLAHASYLIADEKTKEAVVVDPQRDIDQYLKDAAEHGLTIRHVFLTHFHADFLAGHLGLRKATGATIRLGTRAQAEFPFEAMPDRSELVVGDLKLVVWETPGHTPEGISILVYDLSKSESAPEAILTGDTLFIGDVGRPDLLASIGVTADELANMLYDSLRKLLTLPDSVKVYPAHGAGSLCGKNLSKDTVSTIGVQRQYNYALQPMSREAFVALVTEGQPDAPEYFVHDAIMNRKEHATLDETLAKGLVPLTIDQVLAQVAQGAQLVDVRDASDFAAAHMKGSLNIGLGGQYATWAGTVLDKEHPIIIIADDGGEQEAGMRLGRIGYDHIGGYLQGGIEVLDQHPNLVVTTERLTAANLGEELEHGNALFLLDVRTPTERGRGNIAGDSAHIPLNQLKKRLAEVPKDQRVIVYCGGGYRSSIAASLLQREGVKVVQDVIGGFGAWQAFKDPEAIPATCSASK